uniref:Uncharacterized protein n=1 Tax=Utricularia reniformis TaxID=192314 RepID=A0A1Y0B2K2_9LAMI|nr:hypothetical protein AEK19_MT1482 [Utricularia reniformis]ART31672.1 hypothetical protein AEK19_MT1482 [Utricularia reniformis]
MCERKTVTVSRLGISNLGMRNRGADVWVLSQGRTSMLRLHGIACHRLRLEIIAVFHLLAQYHHLHYIHPLVKNSKESAEASINGASLLLSAHFPSFSLVQGLSIYDFSEIFPRSPRVSTSANPALKARMICVFQCFRSASDRNSKLSFFSFSSLEGPELVSSDAWPIRDTPDEEEAAIRLATTNHLKTIDPTIGQVLFKAAAFKQFFERQLVHPSILRVCG